MEALEAGYEHQEGVIPRKRGSAPDPFFTIMKRLFRDLKTFLLNLFGLAEKEDSDSSSDFLTTMMSVPKEMILFVVTSPFPFVGQPVERDLQAKIIEKKVTEITSRKHRVNFIDDYSSFSNAKDFKVLTLKVSTCDGIFEANVPFCFDDDIAVGDNVEARYQKSKEDNSYLKGREIITEKVRIKLALF